MNSASIAAGQPRPDVIVRYEVSEKVQEQLEKLLGEPLTLNHSGTEYHVRCPFHDDRDPSFSLNRMTGAWKCFGCEAHGYLHQLYMRLQELDPNAPEAVYPYVDENGQTLLEVVRYWPKQFFQKQPGQPAGEGNVQGVRRVLYCLPEVLAASTVCIVEGEKDVDRLAELGWLDAEGKPIAVTTNINGAGKWRQEYSECLGGKKVIVLADADDIGETHAEQVARSVQLYASEVRVILTYDDIDVKDVSDYLDTNSAEELRELISNAPLWEPTEPEVKVSEPKKKRPDIVTLVKFSTVEPCSVEFLWAPYLVRGALNILEGDPCTGKTYLGLAISAAVSRGEDLTEKIIHRQSRPTEPRNVIYLSGEDDMRKTLRPRLDKLGANVDRVLGQRVDGRLILERIGLIEEMIKEHNPALLVLDPLQAFLGAKLNMNQANHTRHALSPLSELAERYNCAVLVIRHFSKADQPKAMYKGMGSIDISGAARSVVQVGADPSDSKSFVMAHSKFNLSERGKSVLFTIEGGEFRWVDFSDITADELLYVSAGKNRREKLERAEEFLRTDAEVRRVGRPGKELIDEAEKLGISQRTLERAKQNLGMISRPSGFRGQHLWCYPEPLTIPETASIESI